MSRDWIKPRWMEAPCLLHTDGNTGGNRFTHAHKCRGGFVNRSRRPLFSIFYLHSIFLLHLPTILKIGLKSKKLLDVRAWWIMLIQTDHPERVIWIQYASCSNWYHRRNPQDKEFRPIFTPQASGGNLILTILLFFFCLILFREHFTVKEYFWDPAVNNDFHYKINCKGFFFSSLFVFEGAGLNWQKKKKNRNHSSTSTLVAALKMPKPLSAPAWLMSFCGFGWKIPRPLLH